MNKALTRAEVQTINHRADRTGHTVQYFFERGENRRLVLVRAKIINQQQANKL